MVTAWQFFVTFLGWLSDLLERLSDLQLGDKTVTLNHLVLRFFSSQGTDERSNDRFIGETAISGPDQ